MALDDDLIRLIKKFSQSRDARERALAADLMKIYQQARLHLKEEFLLAHEDSNTLKLEYIESTLEDIDRRMDYYTKLTADERTKAMTDNHILGQQFAIDCLTAGGIDIAITARAGLINKGLVEGLYGNIPKLAGKVEEAVLYRIRDELTRGAIIGESIPKLANRILGTGLTTEGLKKPMSLEYRAKLIARSEVIKFSDLGYEDLTTEAQKVVGEEIYDCWLTAGDGRVEKECKDLARGNNPMYKSVDGMPGVYRKGAGPLPVLSTHPN